MTIFDSDFSVCSNYVVFSLSILIHQEWQNLNLAIFQGFFLSVQDSNIGNSPNIDPNLRNLWMVPDAFCFFILKFISQEFNARFELLYRVHQQVLIDQNTNFFLAKSWSLLIEFFPWFVEMFYKITPILSLKLVKCCMS